MCSVLVVFCESLCRHISVHVRCAYFFFCQNIFTEFVPFTCLSYLEDMTRSASILVESPTDT